MIIQAAKIPLNMQIKYYLPWIKIQLNMNKIKKFKNAKKYDYTWRSTVRLNIQQNNVKHAENKDK